MSNIPYNYGSYIDSKVAMTDNGTVDAGRQMQSPASAGSRGMAKTMQFSKDKTQMQMGNSPIAESMIEIRSILNRIDGVNVPVQEEATIKPYISMYKGKDGKQVYDVLDKNEKSAYKTSDERLAQHFFKKNYNKLREAPVQEAESDYLYLRGKEIDQGSIMYDMQDYSDGIFELQSAKYADGTELDEKELEELESTQELIDWVMIDFVSESAVQEDEPGYYKNPDKEFNINGMTTKKDVVQSIIDNLDNNELDTARDSLNQLLDVVTALHDDYQPMPEGDEFDIEEDEDFEEVLGSLGFPEDETELFDAEYQGRKVPLNKPMRGDSKKFKVYVKDPKTGNVKKVNFGHGGTSAKKLGQKTMKIRKSNPKARKSFRARHNCANPGPKTKARYWSCRKW